MGLSSTRPLGQTAVVGWARTEARGVAGEDDFLVRFWGVRGSIACPGPDTLCYGGNTACVEMRCGPHRLAFDAGTGMRSMGDAMMEEGPLDADLFLSHTHWDHIVGLPFFRPAHRAENRFTVWAGHLAPASSIKAALQVACGPPLFPVPIEAFRAEIIFRDFRAGETLSPRAGLTIHTAPLNHPDGATGYRVEYAGKAVCYVTDTEHMPGMPDRNVLGLIEGADVVIYDSAFTDEELTRYAGWGHSTWQEGVRLCRAAGARQLVLFHHDPGRDDAALEAVERAAAAALPGTVAAREGMTLRP